MLIYDDNTFGIQECQLNLLGDFEAVRNQELSHRQGLYKDQPLPVVLNHGVDFNV
jgi:hypothetical protein